MVWNFAHHCLRMRASCRFAWRSAWSQCMWRRGRGQGVPSSPCTWRRHLRSRGHAVRRQGSSRCLLVLSVNLGRVRARPARRKRLPAQRRRLMPSELRRVSSREVLPCPALSCPALPACLPTCLPACLPCSFHLMSDLSLSLHVMMCVATCRWVVMC